MKKRLLMTVAVAAAAGLALAAVAPNPLENAYLINALNGNTNRITNVTDVVVIFQGGVLKSWTVTP